MAQDDQYQYVKLPDGSYGKFAANATDEEIRGHIQKDFPDAFKGSEPENPQGFLSSLGESSGATGLMHAFRHPLDTIGSIPEGIADEAGRVSGQLKEAWNTPNNEPVKAIDRTLYALPFVGSSLKKADEQASSGNYKGAAGTSVGVMASLLAPGLIEEAAKPLLAKIPSTEHASKLLNEVSTAASGKPVTFTRTTPVLEEAQRLSTYGHGNVTPLNSLYERMNTINPIDFEEARGRYSPLTRLTASDKMAATPQLQAAAKRVAHAMRQDIGDVAESVGKRQQYEQGMKEYGRAMRNKELATKALKYGGRAAAGAAGAGTIYGLTKALKD